MISKEREELIMSKTTRPVGGSTVNYGPATGVPTPESRNEVLGDERYTGAIKPGTTNAVSPGHVEGGPGHADCEEK